MSSKLIIELNKSDKKKKYIYNVKHLFIYSQCSSFSGSK